VGTPLSAPATVFCILGSTGDESNDTQRPAAIREHHRNLLEARQGLMARWQAFLNEPYAGGGVRDETAGSDPA
jgi:hypothetical protein